MKDTTKKNTTSERRRKVTQYVKNLHMGDKVQFSGIYGYTNTHYYWGIHKGKAFFSPTPMGLPYPLEKWKQHILLPEEWGEKIVDEEHYAAYKHRSIFDDRHV